MRFSNTHSRTRTSAITALVLAVSATGCVSVKTHDSVLAERDQLRSENYSLESELAEQTNEADQLRSTYEGLVANLENEVAAGNVEIEQLRDGIKVNLAQEILFESGSTRLGSSGKEVLGRVATQLRGSRNRIDIIGHTDNVQISPRLKSRYPTNWELAGARSASVVKLMQEEGISGKRLFAVSAGPFSPRASNDTEKGRAKNRRIEIRLYPAPKQGMRVSMTSH
jgi:chemotaxis protein MotB